VVPIPYAEETMHGFEYQAAIHMIMHGMEEEGMNVVRGIRRRYDGEKRNPWNEFECGSNYARSMASYALLLAYSGFRFDMVRKKMGMKPLRPGCYFWSLDGAWGVCTVEDMFAELEVLYGKLTLKSWVVPDAEKVVGMTLDGVAQAFTAEEDALKFNHEITLITGSKLRANHR
jgi:non-lysosomal glucosylceramidase